MSGQWYVRVMCPARRHEGWMEVDGPSPGQTPCKLCEDERTPQPKVGWLARRRLHKQLSAYLADQARRPDNEA